MEQIHHHPLNASSICCPEHVHELISIYTQQNREDETLSILLFFSENMETHFLLDNSKSSQDLKQRLGRFYNKFALKKSLNSSTMHQLLDTSFNLLASLPDSAEFLGYLATATSNLAFIAKEEGDLEKAVKLLDKTLSIDKKLEDGAGEIITRINKAAVLNEMSAFREAFFTLKESVDRLEKKVNDFIKSCSEKELKNSKKFKETLQLFLVASVNLLKSLENIDDTSFMSEARSRKQKSYDLGLKYLGESHQLTSYFCEPLRSDRTFSSLGSNLDLSFQHSSKDFSNNSQHSGGKNKSDKSGTSVKRPLFSHSSFSSKDPGPKPVVQNLEKAEKPQKRENIKKIEKIEKIDKPEKLQLSDDRSDRSNQSLYSRQALSEKSESSKTLEKKASLISKADSRKDQQNESQIQKKPSQISQRKSSITRNSGRSEFIRRKISKNSFKSSNNSPLSASHSEDLSNKDVQPLKERVIRLPGSSLPFIPFRACHLKSQTSWKFSPLPSSKSFEYLLDPLKSPISKQFDFNIAGIKIVNQLKRIIICCLEINNNQPNLAITATSEESIEELFTSEYIDLNDLKRILFFLCIDDVMPSYMHAGFVNSFEKFCRFFLMPFIRIVEVQESNSEKIELWARGESLISAETSQLFLNTECNVFLFFVERLTLKLVVCNASDEESSEKSLRVDIVLDEVSANSLVVNHEIPEVYNNTRFVPCIEPFSPGFIEHLDPILSEIELCIKDELGPRTTFDDFLGKNNFVLIRANVSGSAFEKVLWTVQDNRARLGWDIKIKSLHHANSSVRKRAYRLAYFYSYNSLYLNFGVMIDQLENSHIRILAYFVLESLKIELSTDEDLNEVSQNASIIVMPVKSLKSFRGFSKNPHKSPVTLSIVGVNNFLIGIRASLFNVETCSEVSAWLVLDGNFYKLDQPKVKRIEKPKGVLSVKLHETKLLEILEKEKGWEKVMACVKVDKNTIFIVGLQGESLFESLENVLIKGK